MMGHSLAQWQKRVQDLLRVVNEQDFTTTQITEVGIEPALVEYSTVRSRRLVVEVAGAGTPWLALPASWVDGYSSLVSVEYPARQDPPVLLDSQSWRITSAPDDVDETVILLDRSPSASEYVRLAFTATWPKPTADPATDRIDDVGYEACCALAASLCCVSKLGEVARSKHASVPTDWTPTRDQAGDLTAAAVSYRRTYERLLGLPPDGAAGRGQESTSAPAWAAFDFDPSHNSLFHGGRR